MGNFVTIKLEIGKDIIEDNNHEPSKKEVINWKATYQK